MIKLKTVIINEETDMKAILATKVSLKDENGNEICKTKILSEECIGKINSIECSKPNAKNIN